LAEKSVILRWPPANDPDWAAVIEIGLMRVRKFWKPSCAGGPPYWRSGCFDFLEEHRADFLE
jgi:hypothetical protein